MAKLCKNCGFSLTEVLLAVGILSVGMIFIAGVFPAAIHFTTIATERSIAAVAADEAFAKIKLYGIDLNKLERDKLQDFNDVLLAVDIDPNEFAYPSTGTDITQKQYFWSALCRLTEYGVTFNPNPPVQVTAFICRKTGPNLKYHKPNGGENGVRPMPVKVGVSGTVGNNELTIISDETFINDGYTIVDNETGRIYRVLERYRDDPDTILLDRDWEGGSPPNAVWVVPPPVGGGRYPCIAVYQKVIIRF
jgi:prepilin-type N-terminal cleavage/methylation domain-containing protein